MNHQHAKLIALICAGGLSCAAHAQNNAPQAASPTTTGSSAQTVPAPTNPSGTPNPDVIPDPNQTSPAANMPTQTQTTPAQANPTPTTNPQLDAPNPPATANVPASVPPVDAGSAASRPNMAPGNTTPPVTVASAGSNNPNQVFSTLDVGRKGYLSQPDVAINPFLANNFQKCDVNSDGRLTVDEVSGCMQNMPSGGQ